MHQRYLISDQRHESTPPGEPREESPPRMWAGLRQDVSAVLPPPKPKPLASTVDTANGAAVPLQGEPSSGSSITPGQRQPPLDAQRPHSSSSQRTSSRSASRSQMHSDSHRLSSRGTSQAQMKRPELPQLDESGDIDNFGGPYRPNVSAPAPRHVRRAGSTNAAASSSAPGSVPTPASPAPKAATISLQSFSTSVAVDAYLSNLANELSMIAERPTAIFHSGEVDPVESLNQALEVLFNTVDTLADVQTRAGRHVAFLSVRVPPDEHGVA
jgi:hypothetical protein